MESGTDERYVRCRRCHGVFEAGLPNCSRCGAAYTPSPDAPEAGSGSYAEKYMGSEFAPPPDIAPAGPPRSRSGLGLVMAIGAALVVTSLGLGALVVMGALDGPAATARPQDVVVARPATPTPVPTLPPIVAKALDQLADPMIDIHASIRTTVTVNARVTGNSQSVIENMEIDAAYGNYSGTSQTGGISQQWRLVNGTYYVRQMPNGAWKARVGFTPFIILSPLFSLTETRQIQYVGSEVKIGVQADKLESTAWWAPDAGKLSGLDVATLPINPQHTKLQLWVGSDGSPVYAIFRAWTDASDGTGTNLLDITTTYTFSNKSAVMPIPSPTMK